MDWRLMFPGGYFQAVEFGDSKPTFVISEVRICKLEGEDGRTKDKGVVFFEGKDRGWVLCKTNAICLAAMFGTDTSTWVGKSVTLYSTMVQVGKSKQPGIRVRGSPDLTEPLEVEIKLPRKKPTTVTMQATGDHGGPPAKPAPSKAEKTQATAIKLLWSETNNRLGPEEAKIAWAALGDRYAEGRPSKDWTEHEVAAIRANIGVWPNSQSAQTPAATPDRGARIAKIREELDAKAGKERATAMWPQVCDEAAGGRPSLNWTEADITAVSEYVRDWKTLPVQDYADEPGAEG